MKRKIFAFLLILLFVPLVTIPGLATEIGGYVIDDAGLLSDTEIQTLNNFAADIASSYGMDAVIYTVDSLDGKSPQDTADDYYDYNGYGEDGVLFLLAMEEREWYISTAGDARYALTDYGIQQVGNAMLPNLSEGSYYDAFTVFYYELPNYFDALAKGDPIDGLADYSGDYYHGDQEEILYYEGSEEEFTPSLFLSLLAGLAVGGITILIMRAGVNSRRPQGSAEAYMRTGSYDLHTQQDMFLYSTVTKTPKPEPSSSDGGGSSVHSSSSGRSHGGGGGSF